MKRFMAIASTATLAAVLGACAQQGEEAPELGTAESGPRCETSRFDVDLVPSGTAKVFVEMCLPSGDTPSTALLLLAGASYSRRYWDIPDPKFTTRYSFVRAALAAGYATVAIDRIGIGKSTHPPSQQVDMAQNASVAHQVVQGLRAGEVESHGPDVAFDKVVLVGHSLGSLMAFLEATEFQDVDGLVVTGATHGLRAGAAEFFFSQLQPANQVPRFARLHLDPGYLTTIAGTRDEIFYAPSTDFDPKVILGDELTKETVTGLEFAGAVAALSAPLDVRAPTFILMGELDGIFCSHSPGDGGADCSSAAALIAQEAPLYGSQTPCMEAFITPEAGHNVNAFFSSQTSFGAIVDFLDAHIGAGESTPGC